MTHLFKCSKCGQYTLEQQRCPTCGGSVFSPKPPRYSPQDKYGKYRRKAKRKTQQSVAD
ncbi:MAG: RNA-protein complex protein Nop10 [Candidatus Thorarchaeota archaeon]|nr:RNA-protein complex protein Nop10 [Candidatus Thorarchaeota archaeon]